MQEINDGIIGRMVADQRQQIIEIQRTVGKLLVPDLFRTSKHVERHEVLRVIDNVAAQVVLHQCFLYDLIRRMIYDLQPLLERQWLARHIEHTNLRRFKVAQARGLARTGRA